MIIRHDVDDQKYLDLGEEYSSSVAYLGGCAGTLIDSNWILTAAHCVKGRESALFNVQHIDKEYRVETIMVHPKFGLDREGQHDIALMQLKDPVMNGKPAELYDSKDEESRRVVFVGRGTFGNGQEGLIEHDAKQRGATNTIIGTSDQWIEFEFDSPENATTLEGISGSGDSGGPAFITVDERLYVVGVSSRQRGNGLKEGTYGVHEYYTRVSSNIAWIESVINNAEKAADLPVHPIIDAIKTDNEAQFRKTVSNEVLSNEPVMREAFYQSVLLNRVSMAEALLSQGVDISSLVVNQVSLFELAILAKREDYIKMLVFKFKHLKNVHKKDSKILPLAMSVLGEDSQALEPIKILLDQGANINAQTEQGDTTVILAGWLTDDLDLVAHLVERGADVNIPNQNGDTPLIDAASKGKIEILDFLLNHGADIDIKNNDGLSALDVARKRENSEAIKMIVAKSKELK